MCSHRWANNAYVGTEPSNPEARSKPRTPALPPLCAYVDPAPLPATSGASAKTQSTVDASPVVIAWRAR
ncbi:hypothetical protein [Mycobacterium porcinum]|uniref:hypothetical protein n=1 Tax=Mycolicibacterium porcinum TaxID=39693 RepID=UPI0008492EE8|nr:hypothetical protein BHQ19_20350 [Mycolicibacterium porcinum]